MKTILNLYPILVGNRWFLSLNISILQKFLKKGGFKVFFFFKLFHLKGIIKQQLSITNINITNYLQLKFSLK